MAFFLPPSASMSGCLNAVVGLSKWRSGLTNLDHANKLSPFQKKIFQGFVSYKPFDQGLRPLFTQSRRLMTVIASSLTSDIVVTSDKQLTGKWKKNAAMSDDTRELFDFVNLPWMLRKGERFFRYLELERNTTNFRRTINAGGFINVSEVYPLDGASKQLKRRDLRSGSMEGKVERTSDGLKTVVSWGEPYGVSMEETFCLSEDANQLTVYTSAIRPLCGQTLKIKQVFTRM